MLRAALISLAVVILVAVSAGVISSCAAAGPAMMTAMAGGASVYSRSHGGCYAECVGGTRCNPNNGLCEKIDCHCGDGFRCVGTETGTACVVADHQAELAARPQEVVSGAQPFGDGQEVSQPLTGTGFSGGIGESGPGNVEATRPGASDAGPADAGVKRGAAIDGGTAIPSTALKTGPVKLKDPPPNTPPATQPWLEANPWDPHHVDAAPQMSNPNQPPPH